MKFDVYLYRSKSKKVNFEVTRSVLESDANVNFKLETVRHFDYLNPFSQRVLTPISAHVTSFLRASCVAKNMSFSVGKMRNSLKLSTLAIGVMVMIPSWQAQAHGWVSFPSARQNTCFLDGGFWDNTIPNQACQNVYDESGAYPFVQRNEVSANVADYHNLDAVKAVVVDGQLCSAADSAKSGLNIPSPDWQKTAIRLDENNQIELVFTATAVHHPSFWQFYLTRPDYQHDTPLTWSDLVLVDQAGDVSVDENKQFRIKVTLPPERSGDAVLLTRWQRDDPAGEGFYNCSDIQFDDNGESSSSTDGGGSESSTPEADLISLGYFAVTGFGPVEPGDSVRFRSFDAQGSEMSDIRLAITANNTQTWAAEIAAQFNQANSDWYIGIWHQEMQHYMFDSDNLYANQVFAPSNTYSYQLSLIKQDTIDVESTWQAELIYDTGDTVFHNQQWWTAQWWTQGEEPGTTGQWGVWR